jgi:acetyltransferase-like isoleucine patch superfamily enzyme
MNLRAKIKNSDLIIFKLIKYFYYGFRRFTIPAPKIIWRPIWIIVDLLRDIYYWLLSTFWITPLFKGFCENVGKKFKAGTFLPYVIGKGKLYIGDNVRINGKLDFLFGGIKKEYPEIHIGSRTNIGHNITFDISGTLEIGEHCLIASDIYFQDCSGHSINSDERDAGKPPQPKDVRPIKIGNNVWIGNGVYILPGSIIGNNCVISAKTVVSRRIPDNHLVYPAVANIIKIRKLSKII